MNSVLIRKVLGICLLLATQNLRAQKELPVLQIQIDTLENGLQVIYQPDSSVGEVVVEFWMKAGIAHEAPGQYGIAHFYEHVTPYGLTGKPEKRIEFDSFLTGSNAQTLKDFTRYYLKTKPAGLAVTLEYAADRMAASADAITEAKVARERKRVLREIERQSKYPFWSLEGGNGLDQATFGPNHPYGHGAYGTLDNNRQFSRADFQQWHDQYLWPENSILFLVGSFDESKAREFVQTYFETITKEVGNPPATIPEPSFTDRINKGRAQTKAGAHYSLLVWPLPEYGHRDHPAVLLTAYLLEHRLRQMQPGGWNMPAETSPGVLYRTYDKGGQLAAYVPFSKDSEGERVSQQLQEAVRGLLDKGITTAELAMAKDQAGADLRSKLDRLGFQSSRTELIGQGLLFAGDADFYRKEWRQMQGASVGDVQRVMDKWLAGTATEVVILGEPNRTEEGKNE